VRLIFIEGGSNEKNFRFPFFREKKKARRGLDSLVTTDRKRE